jgi:hypothetical protein
VDGGNGSSHTSGHPPGGTGGVNSFSSIQINNNFINTIDIENTFVLSDYGAGGDGGYGEGTSGNANGQQNGFSGKNGLAIIFEYQFPTDFTQIPTSIPPIYPPFTITSEVGGTSSGYKYSHINNYYVITFTNTNGYNLTTSNYSISFLRYIQNLNYIIVGGGGGSGSNYYSGATYPAAYSGSGGGAGGDINSLTNNSYLVNPISYNISVGYGGTGGTTAGLNGGTNRNDFGDFAVSYLDSPATTSSTTYKVQAKSSAGGTVYWCNQTNNSVSTITAMEISA